MFWLGLILPICFIPGWTGVSIPSQWVLLSFILPFSLWRTGHMSVIHWLGALFLAYAFAHLLSVVVFYDAIYALWTASLWALAFWLGSTTTSLSALFRGLACGLYMSIAVAIAQRFGIYFVLTFNGNFAGLLFNQTVQAAVIALTIVGLVCYRHWLYIPALLPGLYLANSRGGYLILAVGLAARYLNLWLCAAALVACALFYNHFADLSDSYRLQTWALAVKSLTWWGHGPGSFMSVLFWTKGTQIHPEFVHNDYIQLAFEYGLGAIPFLMALGLCALQRHAREWPVLIAFCALMSFYFPLQHAFIAFIGLVCAGRCARDADFAWLSRYLWGPPVVAGSYQARLILSRTRGPSFPL